MRSIAEIIETAQTAHCALWRQCRDRLAQGHTMAEVAEWVRREADLRGLNDNERSDLVSSL